jgi:hypothetical protein
LFYRLLDIGGLCLSHRLDSNGVIAADIDITDFYDFSFMSSYFHLEGFVYTVKPQNIRENAKFLRQLCVFAFAAFCAFCGKKQFLQKFI